MRPKLERFDVRFLPPHSSPLNSVERLWSLIKGRFRQLLGLSNINAPANWPELAACVLAIAERIPLRTIDALLRANRRDLVALLEAQGRKVNKPRV